MFLFLNPFTHFVHNFLILHCSKPLHFRLGIIHFFMKFLDTQLCAYTFHTISFAVQTLSIFLLKFILDFIKSWWERSDRGGRWKGFLLLVLSIRKFNFLTNMMIVNVFDRSKIDSWSRISIKLIDWIGQMIFMFHIYLLCVSKWFRHILFKIISILNSLLNYIIQEYKHLSFIILLKIVLISENVKFSL